ncbi:unnamed protein product, partial [Iphiclides podalirius]
MLFNSKTFCYLFITLFYSLCVYASNYGSEDAKTDQNIIHDSILDTFTLIRRYGYPCEIHRVYTEDKYVLEMHRVPYGRNQSDKVEQRPVAFLQHGLLSSSAEWVLMTPGKGLAYILADAGYDVWMGNARGNTYSRNHVYVKPTQSAFWQFSWHEIGYYDLPAMIDYSMKETGVKKVQYIGFSQGTTAFWVMASMRPEYNEKVTAMHALAPIAFIRNIRSPLIKAVAPFTNSLERVMKLLGANEFLPNGKINELAGEHLCVEEAVTQVLCKNLLFLICGFDNEQMNNTMLPVVLGHTPAGASTRQIIHFGQLYNSDDFLQFDFGRLHARAWSHFCTDKSDHLVEIIKRNNETCRPKYVPTDVIVNTLMGTKNAEITRLRRKIEEFEQLLAAYDQLDLTCEQKIEIANAHAAIKAANKELDDMCLDLDLSGYTEGIDSEAFEISEDNELDSKMLFDQIESQKEEINKLKNALFFKEEEKEQLQVGYQEKIVIINNLRLEIEDWRRTCEKQTQRSNTLEILTKETQEELKKLNEENKNLIDEVETKNIAIDNLMNVREVEEMKKEKEFNLKQIKKLSDKLHESNEAINSLTQDISERDERISILENQVNELGNEVQRLQTSLGSMIDLGEEMNSRNHEIDQSLKQIEAHHSKATHDMRIDLAKFIKENVKLEEKLSSTNVEVGMLTEEKNAYNSQEINLQDEKKKIVANIQELETRCIGESALSQNNCGVQSLQSLHEETLQDILKVHENETDNLRSMSIEAMRKVDKLENENKILKSKILTSNSSSLDEALDIKELSFLHYKVCRTWKTILRKEETLHKRIDSLETELLNKQKQTQRHIAELDRKVAEERQRLQEVREAVCRDSLTESRANSSHPRKATPSLEHSIPEQDLTMAMFCQKWTSRSAVIESSIVTSDQRVSAVLMIVKTPDLKKNNMRCKGFEIDIGTYFVGGIY